MNYVLLIHIIERQDGVLHCYSNFNMDYIKDHYTKL